MKEAQVPEEPTQKKAAPPYLPYKTFKTFLEAMTVFLPDRIDRSVMPSSSGSTKSWLLAALRYFGLIDESNAPTEPFKRLVKAAESDRPKILREIVTKGYPTLFNGFSLHTATARQLDEKFDELGVSGGTAKKSVTFFKDFARDAEVQLSPFLKSNIGRRSGGPRRKPAAPSRTKSAARGRKVEDDETPGDKPESLPDGFERLPIPGRPGAFIQYPKALTDADVKMFEAQIGTLRIFLESRGGAK